MRTVLFGCAALAAAIAAAPAPAQAQFSAPAASAPQSLPHGVATAGGDWADGGDGWRHRRDRRTRVNVFVGNWSGGEWARYNNRSWEPDSFNDWWHDRPDRSFPRWVYDNQNCDRRWWSGGVWRC